MTKPIRLFGKKVTEEELFQYIKKLIDNGKTGTTEIASEIGKDARQARRYLIKMSELGMLTLDAGSGRIIKTTMQEEADKFEAISMDEFTKNPVIAKWIHECEGRVKAETLAGYKNSVKRIFKELPVNPKYVCASRANALEYWNNYQIAYKKRTGKTKVSQPLRIAFRNLIDSHGISFGHKMGKKYGLGSEHDSFKKYAGISLIKFVPKLKSMMIEAKDFETLLWFMCGIRTSARGGALATMTWERIYFDRVDEENMPLFEIEIHETKVPKGHYHLGEDGNWFTYHLNDELKQLFQEWKNTHPTFRRFVWFEDTGEDSSNRKKARWIHEKMAEKLASYYKQIESEFDPLLKEYVKKRPDHVMCHTFAQLCKNEGMSDEEIKEAGHWTDSQSVSWYCATEESKVRAIKKKVMGLNF